MFDTRMDPSPGLIRRFGDLIRAPALTSPDAWAQANRVYGPETGLPGPRNPYLSPSMVPLGHAAVSGLFVESVGRYKRVFTVNPPTAVAQFVERVPMVKGRVDRKASTATGYAWIVWEKSIGAPPQLLWIPPCRKSLEKPEDYGDKFLETGRVDCTPVQPTLF